MLIKKKKYILFNKSKNIYKGEKLRLNTFSNYEINAYYFYDYKFKKWTNYLFFKSEKPMKIQYYDSLQKSVYEKKMYNYVNIEFVKNEVYKNENMVFSKIKLFETTFNKTEIIDDNLYYGKSEYLELNEKNMIEINDIKMYYKCVFEDEKKTSTKKISDFRKTFLGD